MSDQRDPFEMDREAFRPEAHEDRFASIRSALDGLWFVLRTEQSFRLLLAYTVILLALTLWLEITVMGFAVILFALGVTWITECLNTAIEAVVDLTTSDYHPLAKVAKDVGGTAALLSSLLSVGVSLVILGPPLMARLSG